MTMTEWNDLGDQDNYPQLEIMGGYNLWLVCDEDRPEKDNPLDYLRQFDVHTDMEYTVVGLWSSR